MPDAFDRSLTILADGFPVSGYARCRLSGQERLGLAPALFSLRLLNLPEDEALLLSRAREVTVAHASSVLVSSPVSDVFSLEVPGGRETQLAILPGLPLWEARVSLSLPAGISVSETVRRLLLASGTGIPLLSFPGEDPVFSRPQAFCGRAAECVEEALGRAGARACLLPSGVSVVPSEGLPLSLSLREEDLLIAPEATRGGALVVRARPAGWTLGKAAEVRFGSVNVRGLISERFLDLDTSGGPWLAELLLEAAEG